VIVVVLYTATTMLWAAFGATATASEAESELS